MVVVTVEVPRREAIPAEFKWRLETIFASDEDWEREYEALSAAYPKLASFAGRLGEGPDVLLACLRARDETFRRLEKLFVYAHLRRDEDATRARYQDMVGRATNLYSRAEQTVSYLEPELVALPDERLEAFYAAEPDLALYRRYLAEVRRQRDHVRSPEVEELLAAYGEVEAAPANIFHILNDADLELPVIEDDEGQPVKLSHGRYLQYLRSRDRRVRKAAFEGMLGTYRRFARTIGAVYEAAVKATVFVARARRYPSTLAMALDSAEVPVEVYDRLIETVHQHLPALHRYLDLRRRVLGLPELHMYDLYVPIVGEADRRFPWAEAKRLVTEALTALGEDYAREVAEGLESGWVDVYENVGKRSGGYSSGAYDTQPFILLNYQDALDDVYTLAHELGHSMHSLYTRRRQPWVYGHYKLFVAEVASTLNEALLSHHLLSTSDDRALRLHVLNHDLEHIRTTLYRQTLFAEFEREVHRRAEAGDALTADTLSELYLDVNRRYYGAAVDVDELIAYEWARIPHFFRPFYVYQYATGLSAAEALALRVIEEGEPAVARYRGFLAAGDSDGPIELLRQAGVDMTTAEPVAAALRLFDRRVQELERLLLEG
jgi:oligoendopeptidase F